VRATDRAKRIRHLRLKLALAAMPITADDMPRRAKKAANRPEQVTAADMAFMASRHQAALQVLAAMPHGRHIGPQSRGFAMLLRCCSSSLCLTLR
jgi:hypothetical protein